MQFRIDVDNGISIYEQIVRQVKFSIAEGSLVAGQIVPSVRELAKQLALNPNTVQRAYMELQNDNVLETMRGRGMAVSCHPRPGVNQWAEMQIMSCGRASFEPNSLPSACQLLKYSLPTNAFMGLPCPRNNTGKRSLFLSDAICSSDAISVAAIVMSLNFKKCRFHGRLC